MLGEHRSGKSPRSFKGDSLRDFDDEVQKRSADLSEPMRGAGWNHDDVSLGKMVSGAALDFFSARFAGPGDARALDRAARHKRGRAFEDIKDVGVVFVKLDLTWFHPAAGLDLVTRVDEQRLTAGERAFDGRVINKLHFGRRRFRGEDGLNESQGKE